VIGNGPVFWVAAEGKGIPISGCPLVTTLVSVSAASCLPSFGPLGGSAAELVDVAAEALVALPVDVKVAASPPEQLGAAVAGPPGECLPRRAGRFEPEALQFDPSPDVVPATERAHLAPDSSAVESAADPLAAGSVADDSSPPDGWAVRKEDDRFSVAVHSDRSPDAAPQSLADFRSADSVEAHSRAGWAAMDSPEADSWAAPKAGDHSSPEAVRHGPYPDGPYPIAVLHPARADSVVDSCAAGSPAADYSAALLAGDHFASRVVAGAYSSRDSAQAAHPAGDVLALRSSFRDVHCRLARSQDGPVDSADSQASPEQALPLQVFPEVRA
jgi:hypothetical protein